MSTIYLYKDSPEYATPERTAPTSDVTLQDINDKIAELTQLCQSNTNRILRLDNLLRSTICLFQSLHSYTDAND